MSVRKLLAEYEERQRKAKIRQEFFEKFKPVIKPEIIEQKGDIKVLDEKESKKLLEIINR